MTDISSKRYNLDNFEASFREFLQNNHVRAGRDLPLQSISIKNYLSDLRHFMGWFTFYLHSRHSDGPKPETADLSTIASLIDFEAVSSYKMYLESNALPVKSVNRRLSTLRKFCTFCIQQNWMKENVAKRVGNVGAHPSLSLRGTSETSDVAISDGIASSPAQILERVPRNDILSEFKKYLLSEQSKMTNVETTRRVVSTKDIDLITDDVQEFLLICHPA